MFPPHDSRGASTTSAFRTGFTRLHGAVKSRFLDVRYRSQRRERRSVGAGFSGFATKESMRSIGEYE